MTDMTLNDFVDAVMRKEISEKAILSKWGNFCSTLAAYDVQQITDLIREDALENLCDMETMDWFGTEGMSL